MPRAPPAFYLVWIFVSIADGDLSFQSLRASRPSGEKCVRVRECFILLLCADGSSSFFDSKANYPLPYCWGICILNCKNCQRTRQEFLPFLPTCGIILCSHTCAPLNAAGNFYCNMETSGKFRGILKLLNCYFVMNYNLKSCLKFIL